MDKSKRVNLNLFNDLYYLEALLVAIDSDASVNRFSHSIDKLISDIKTGKLEYEEVFAQRVVMYLWCACVGEARHACVQSARQFFIREGLDESFADIRELSRGCRFADCSHTTEIGCALLSALEGGELSQERYQSYLSLLKESEYYQMSYVEKRERDRKFGQFIKSAMKHNKKK